MVVAVLALALVVSAEPALPSPRLAVLVRVDTHGLERHVRVADVIREIQTLWAPYADIDFTDLDAPSKRAYDDEIRLVVDRVPSGAPSVESLAWISFTAPGHPADLITVSIDGVRKLMDGGRWGNLRLPDLTGRHRQQFMTRALARSAAHEIGHYLLRSSVHSRTGLMRDRLWVDLIMENDLRRFHLEAPQIAVLRRRAFDAGGRAASASVHDQPPHSERSPAPVSQ